MHILILRFPIPVRMLGYSDNGHSGGKDAGNLWLKLGVLTCQHHPDVTILVEWV